MHQSICTFVWRINESILYVCVCACVCAGELDWKLLVINVDDPLAVN